MQYDPIKQKLGHFFNRHPYLRILFYHLLDLLLLRTWHIRREIKKWARTATGHIHILDAGSGFGQYTYFLSGLNKVWNVLGVDVKTDQVCDCNKFFYEIGRSNTIFKTEDLTKFVVPDTFNLILSVDVMEHILEDELVFRNFYKSLKPGGMVLISTPSDQGGSDVEAEGESFIEEHVRDGYGKQEIEDKLKRAGFVQVDVQYSYGKPGQLSWKLSMKYPLKMLGLSKFFFIILPFYYLITFPVCLILNYMDVKEDHPTGTGLIVKAWK